MGAPGEGEDQRRRGAQRRGEGQKGGEDQTRGGEPSFKDVTVVLNNHLERALAPGMGFLVRMAGS